MSAEEAGSEHLMLAIQTATDLLLELQLDQQQQHGEVDHEAEEQLQEDTQEQGMKGDGSHTQCCSDLSQVCLFIDHMNDHLSYMKKVNSWCKELGLSGIMLYRMRSKHINAVSGGGSVTPKGRAEDIYVLLEGEASDTKDFLTRLRTFKMTSQDRREKKSKVM